jgi:hypothetical protein
MMPYANFTTDGEGLGDLLHAVAERTLPLGAFNIEADRAGPDLARIVLGLVEFTRRLLETQALQRMESGSLSPEDEEKIGLALMRAGEAVRTVAGGFGLSENDLDFHFKSFGQVLCA